MQEKESFIKKVFRISGQHKLLLGFITVILIITLWALFGDKGFIARKKLERENTHIYQQFREDSAKAVSLEKEIDELNKSDKKLEKVAREKFGMTKPGEKIYKIIVDSTSK